MLSQRRWSSVQMGNYFSAKQITGRLPDFGMWNKVMKFSNFQVMKSVVLWVSGIVGGFLLAVHIWLAPKHERKNGRVMKLYVYGMSNKRKSSWHYHFGMHGVMPTLRVVRIWLGVETQKKVFSCGTSNVEKYIDAYRCRRDAVRRIR